MERLKETSNSGMLFMRTILSLTRASRLAELSGISLLLIAGRRPLLLEMEEDHGKEDCC